MLRSALFSKMKAWNPNGKLCGRMDVQNLSVLERYILDGMSQIHGALTATTPHELSNTPIKSNSPHKEGHTKTAFIQKSRAPMVTVSTPQQPRQPIQPRHMALAVTYGPGDPAGSWREGLMCALRLKMEEEPLQQRFTHCATRAAVRPWLTANRREFARICRKTARIQRETGVKQA